MRLRLSLAFTILVCLALVGQGYGAGAATDRVEGPSTIKEFGAACDGTTADDAAFALVMVLQRSVVIPRSSGACRLSGNLTFPATMEVVFERGGQISVDVGKTLTIAYLSAPDAQVFAGSGAVLLSRVSDINPNWFGADPSARTSSSTALQKAVDAAQDSGVLATVRFTPGIYAMDATVNLVQSNAGITIAGPTNTALMQGSIYPAVTLRWTGGASPMFTIGEGNAVPAKAIGTSYVQFHDLAIENAGRATMWLNIQAGGNMIIRRITASANPPASAAFSTALMRSKSNVVGQGGGLNYSTIEASEFNYSAPVIFLYDNQNAANTYTWLHFDNNLVNANAHMNVIAFANGGGKILRVQGNTFNSQPAASAPFTFTVVELTSIGASTLENFIFRDNEVDDSGGTTSASKSLKLRRVVNGDISNNNFVGNGSNTSMIQVLDSDTVTVCNNRANSVNGPLVNTADAKSRVVFCPNIVNLNNVAGLINNSTTGAGLIDVTANGGNIVIEGHKGLPSGQTVYRWDAPDRNNYTVTLATPGESVPSYATRGQIFTIQIRNTTGGAMGTITFNATYKTAGAFTSPASGKSRSLTCVYDGAHCVEIYRSAADVTN
jgi:hypothetical protein